NGVGTIGDPACGDFLRVYVQVEGDVIQSISFLCQGCPAAIASGSATCELALGKTIHEAVHITEETVSDYLGGLPGEKMHCSNLGVGALRYALADCLGIRTDCGDNRVPVIERLRGAATTIAMESGLLDAPLAVAATKLPEELAVGNTADRDYPIWKGKEGIVEARLLDGVGQAFSPVPSCFSGELRYVLALNLAGTDETALRNRGVFVASVNALCRHLGIAEQTIHCRDEGPRECAKDLLGVISAGSPDDSRITLIGCQPRMIEALSSDYQLRVIDLDPDNIAKSVGGITVEGEEKTGEALDWYNIALVTGSTLVTGAIDRFVGLKCHTVFYGITIAGAAALLRLHRFCTRGL
ncbi:MAG: iron-sulfur cluster assembly scaffold protein, partial [Armatimonadota bacterium]